MSKAINILTGIFTPGVHQLFPDLYAFPFAVIHSFSRVVADFRGLSSFSSTAVIPAVCLLSVFRLRDGSFPVMRFIFLIWGK